MTSNNAEITEAATLFKEMIQMNMATGELSGEPEHSEKLN